jgi:hypothetical protein
MPFKPEQTYTIDMFCEAESISRGRLYDEWKQGTGPRFYWNGKSRRITHQARLDWQRQKEAAAAMVEAE